MDKKNFTALFAVIMLLIFILLAPVLVEQQFNDTENIDEITGIPTASAATLKTNVSEYLNVGYVGDYGSTGLPAANDSNPQVLGMTAERNISPPLYQALEVDRSNAVINLNPGQAVTVWVDFLNTGQATWYKYGEHFVALNTTNPAGRTSSFQHEFWNEYNYRPTRLLQNQVRPGETGRFRFALQAPTTTGTYQENFHLVAENLIWIDGGYTSFPIGVGQSVSPLPYYRAEEVARSKGGTIIIDPGQSLTFWIDFKNTGLRTWYNNDEHFIALNVSNPVGRVSLFKHNYWNEYYYRPTRLLQSKVAPGEIGRFRFALQAPEVAGYYTEKFTLVAENLLWLPGGQATLNFQVGNPPQPEESISYSITNESTIRIGLYNTDELVTVTANGSYTITNVNDNTITAKLAGESVSINHSTDAYWRLVPDANSTIMEITNFANSPLWNSSLNDNTFRGVLEIRYSEEAEQMWIINELPLESYLAGLAEVANEQPAEYLKALTIAARSYALWHALNGGKHPDKFFDINATTDQIYRGYGFEQRSEDPLTAVQATTGQVATHPAAVSQLNPQGIIIGAYFSGTDGRTRNWTEVWAGSGFPWLVSVDDPYGILPNWNTLEGNHMVGMSAKGARGYVTEENKTYDWILKHYYTGVNIEKLY